MALGKVDYYEAVSISDHLSTSDVWYRLLNAGFRIPAAAGTDAMANYASLRGPVGMNRVFAKVDGPLDHAAFLAAIKAGRTMATNGPLVELAVRASGGAWTEPGGEIALPAGKHRLEARVSLRSIVPVDKLEVVASGRVVATVPLTGDRTTADAVVPGVDRPLRLARASRLRISARAIPCSTSTPSGPRAPSTSRSAARPRALRRTPATSWAGSIACPRPPPPTRATTPPPRRRPSSQTIADARAVWAKLAAEAP